MPDLPVPPPDATRYTTRNDYHEIDDTPDEYAVKFRDDLPGGCMIWGRYGERWEVNLTACGTRALVRHLIGLAGTVPGRCEHGVKEGDWCQPCNAAYKAAERNFEEGRDDA